MKPFKLNQTYKLSVADQLKPVKIHIVAIVDDVWIVYKYCSRGKNSWHYNILKDKILDLLINVTAQISENKQ